MNSQGPLAITPRLARPSAKVATVVAPSTFPSPHTHPSARERLTRDVRKSAHNSFEAKRHACRWPKQKPGPSFAPSVPGLCQRATNDGGYCGAALAGPSTPLAPLGPGICFCTASSLLFRKRPQLAGESVIASFRSQTTNAIQA